ncbi:MAG TPA: hypothetical protein VJV79_29095 [Polyangiaceae bacterium]|nr:hypothetical protein [Polyangiaceae bacterium]
MICSRYAVFLAVALLPACQADDSSSPGADSGVQDGSSLAQALTLQLASEKKLSKLLPPKEVDHYEASGIVASGGMLYMASDNLTRIAAIDTSLNSGELGPGEVTNSQYEGITVSADGRFFTIIENGSSADGRPEVAELDADTAFVSQSQTDAVFEHPNNAFEGVAWLSVSGKEYLLALCENNNCNDADSPPGEGRARLLSWVDGVWITEATLKLPKSAAFLNYSDLSLRSNGDGTYAALVVSRKSSALWLGTLSTSTWTFAGPSTFYTFPRTAQGAVQYCSVEGVTFLGPNLLAAVSDKTDDGKPCTEKAESIHIFQMPQ